MSEPFLNEVAAQMQETIHLAVPSVNEVVYIAKVDSPHSIRMASRIGARMPIYSTSLGKAILAHPFRSSGRDRLRRHAGANLLCDYFTQALRAKLERVRAQGFAIDDQENEIGAISVPSPANRMSKERSLELGPLVRDAALEVSRRIGYPR